MAIYLMPVHAVAHIHPELDTGTGDDNYPYSNARTLNHKAFARLTAVGTLVRLDFDRSGAAGIGIVDSLAVFNSNISVVGGDINIYQDTDVNFTTPTTLLSETPTVDNFFYRLDSSATERYLRFEWSVTSGTLTLGFMSLGRSYQVAPFGPQIPTEQAFTQRSGTPMPNEDITRWLRSYRLVDRTVAETLLEESRAHWLMRDANTIDAIGGGGGPIILGDTQDNSLYLGKATVRLKPWESAFTEVFVDMEQERQTLLT